MRATSWDENGITDVLFYPPGSDSMLNIEFLSFSGSEIALLANNWIIAIANDSGLFQEAIDDLH